MSKEPSPEMKQTVSDFTRGRDAVARLERWAFTGDAAALIALVDLAKAATAAVQGLWFNEVPTTPAPFYNPFTEERSPGTNYLSSTASRREALHFWCGGLDWQMFPVFAFRDGTKWATRQEAMMRGVRRGPAIKGKAHKENPVRFLIEDLLRPTFLDVQYGKQPEDGIEAEIFLLQPLTKKNIDHWADVAARWLAKQNRGQLRLHENTSKLYKIADPDTELRKVKKGKKSALKKWKQSALKKSGTLILGVIDQTKYNERDKKIELSEVTEAMIRNCLKARILAWLRANIED